MLPKGQRLGQIGDESNERKWIAQDKWFGSDKANEIPQFGGDKNLTVIVGLQMFT